MTSQTEFLLIIAFIEQQRERSIINLLKDFELYKAEISDIDIQIKDLKELKNYGTEAIAYDKAQITRTFKYHSKTEHDAVSAVETIKYLQLKQRWDLKIVHRIENAISHLCQDEQEVIKQKYIKNQTWSKVSSLSYMDERTCRYISKNAIKKMSKVLYENVE